MAYLTDEQLKELNFKFLGKNVKISNKSAIYGCQNIEIDDHARIDDFCIISASKETFHIGKYVHIACYSSLIGTERIEMHDFSGLSSRVSIYSSSDDYSGSFLTNPTVPDKYKNVDSRPVILKKHVIIGSGTVILPGVTIGEGASVGALSLANRNCEPFTIYVGVPVKKVKDRNRGLLELEARLIQQYTNE